MSLWGGGWEAAPAGGRSAPRAPVIRGHIAGRPAVCLRECLPLPGLQSTAAGRRHAGHVLSGSAEPRLPSVTSPGDWDPGTTITSSEEASGEARQTN